MLDSIYHMTVNYDILMTRQLLYNIYIILNVMARICIFNPLMYSKPVLIGHSKIDKTEIFMANGSLMKVKSTAKFCNTFGPH